MLEIIEIVLLDYKTFCMTGLMVDLMCGFVIGYKYANAVVLNLFGANEWFGETEVYHGP